MSVQIQRFDAGNAYVDENLKMSSTRMPSTGRLPLQPRNPNTYHLQHVVGSMSSSSSGGSNEDGSSSTNEKNKARISSFSRSGSTSNNGLVSPYPVEVGSETNSSVITHTGAAGPQAVRATAATTAAATTTTTTTATKSQSEKAGLDIRNVVAKSMFYNNTASSSKPRSDDQDIIIEEKRRRLNGEGYTTHRYLRGRMLGKGGFAKVYMCTALDTNKNYAVKIVPKANLVKPRARQKLQAEIKIHRTLKHRHVCEYKHFFEDRNNCYILLELCHNQSMNEMIKRRKRITEPESAYLMQQLIEAVEYMHSQRVIHRDLKLGNLFLDKEMNIKVGDLGLATKLESDEEKRKTICGTPNYIAPEVIQGSKETRGHSFEVDIWSMGVILFTTLVGKPPYEAKDVKATYQRIIANEYHFPSHVNISVEARDLIGLMLQSRPEDRPTLDEIRIHPFLTNPLPSFLPSSVLHIAPEWTMNDFGEMEIVPRHDHGDSKKSYSRSSSSAQRQPLGSRDPNVFENRMADKLDKEVRTATSRALGAIGSALAATSGPAFRIYDESGTDNPKTKDAQYRPVNLDELVSKASALVLGGTTPQSDPTTATKSGTTTDSDVDVLVQMLHTLTEVLDVTEARKYSYSSANTFVRPSSRGGPPVWVTRYVDYTSKYGLGFLLNDGSSGVYFNDSTKAVLESEGDRFRYVERRKAESKESGGRKLEPIVQEHTLSNFPDDLQKKVTLLKHFRNYLVEQQKKSDEEKLRSSGDGHSSLTYLKKWVRTKHAILFRLSNQTVQIVFYDQTEVLLTPDERYVTYVDKKRQRLTYLLNDELVGCNPEMAKRLKYAKEILHQLLAGQQRR